MRSMIALILAVECVAIGPAVAQGPDTLYAGSPLLTAAALTTRWDTLDTYSVRNGQRRENGQVIYGLVRTRDAGTPVVLLILRFTSRDSSDLGAVSIDTVALDGTSLAPRWERTHAPTDSADVVYQGGRVRGYAQHAGQPRQEINRTLPGRLLPLGLAHLLPAMLPLHEGYRYRTASYDKWSDTIREADVVVRGGARLELGTGTVSTWVIETMQGRGTHLSWYDSASGRLVQTHDIPPADVPAGDGGWTVRAGQSAAPSARHGLASVSPDGRWIAFVGGRPGAREVYVIGTDGAGERQVTHSGGRKGRTAWTGDGRLLFTAGVNGTANDTSNIFMVPAAGGDPVLLGTAPGRGATLSPDGTRVLYAQGSWQASRLVVSSLDGSAAREITSGTPPAWTGRWSPDGAWIAYEQADSNRVLNVWMVHPDGSSAHQVTRQSAADGGAQIPAWSPDGRRVAFQAGGPAGHVWIADTTGAAPVKLGAHTARYLDEIPLWFPDGRRLAFQSDRTGRMEIWVVNVDGRGLRQLTR